MYHNFFILALVYNLFIIPHIGASVNKNNLHLDSNNFKINLVTKIPVSKIYMDDSITLGTY